MTRLPENQPLLVELDWSELRGKWVAEFRGSPMPVQGIGQSPERAVKELIHAAAEAGIMPHWAKGRAA